jgi:hypothetical protein
MVCSGVLLASGGSFRLQSVREGGGAFGPFGFEDGGRVIVSEGEFGLKLISGHSFKLVERSSGDVYGVYELVPGRIIDVGGTLYEITDVKLPENVPVLRNRRASPFLTTLRVVSRWI